MFALISKDAGGAEYVSRYGKKIKGNFHISCEGPAKKIFRKNLKKKRILNYKTAINKSTTVICSTGTSSNYEKRAMIYALKKNKKLIVFLDSWTEYEQRFTFKGKKIIPTQIFVSDIFAKNLIKKQNFKNIKIVGNPYLEDFKKYIKLKKKIKKNNFKKILFLTEPVSKDLKKFYTEKTCLNFFLESLKYIKFKYKHVNIRPHPSESNIKYSWVKKKYKSIIISKKKNLFQDIYESDLIFGINSVALVLGLLAKKKVICSINSNNKCNLPHKNILYLRKILRNKNYFFKI